MNDSIDVSVVEVTDADRSAARNAVECVTDSPPKARPAFADLWEDDLAEAFAYHRIAATHTPSAETTRVLVEALEGLERRATKLYRGIAPGGNYGVNCNGSNANQSTFADADENITAARAALARYRSGEQ